MWFICTILYSHLASFCSSGDDLTLEISKILKKMALTLPCPVVAFCFCFLLLFWRRHHVEIPENSEEMASVLRCPVVAFDSFPCFLETMSR